jgi:hypothetical protein
MFDQRVMIIVPSHPEKDVISSSRLGARKVAKSIYNNIYQRNTK